jgi:hypothetical protein
LVSISDVKAKIAEGEGQRLEFKRSEILSNTIQLAIELTAFANADGGMILIGVKDDGTFERMMARRGHQELIMNVASDRCVPPVRPLFEQKLIDGNLVYVIQVQKGSTLHGVKFRGGTAFYIRVGSTVRSLHPTEVAGKSGLVESPKATNNPEFESSFSSVLDSLVNSLQQNDFEQAHHLTNEVVKLLKERIEAWDEPSTAYGTREVFTRLYALSEREAPELYVIFKDLFGLAYRERKQLLEAMTWTIKKIMMDSWAPEHNVEKAERASKLLLRLGVDFFHQDLSVTELCASAIDDLASDMFEPEILSKEILLAAYAYGETQARSTEKELAFVDQLVDSIRVNDEYAWDALYKSYFIDSLGLAFAEKENYGIDLRDITVRFLYSSINKNINQQIQGFVDFLESEVKNKEHDYSFDAEELVQMIMAYESVRPDIAREIEKRILGSDTDTQGIFIRLIDSSTVLTKIYKGTDMITTFDELMTFLETNSDFENVSLGVTAFGVTIIYFRRPLTESEMQRVKDLASTYDIGEELELDRDQLLFEVDRLVYKDGRHNMRKLLDFLRDLSSIAMVRSVATGINFDLRSSPE